MIFNPWNMIMVGVIATGVALWGVWACWNLFRWAGLRLRINTRRARQRPGVPVVASTSAADGTASGVELVQELG